MRKNTRRTFLTAAVPALVAAPVAARQTPSTTSTRKRVYRTSTGPFKKDGPPLYSQELSFGNLVFVSGKGGGVKATGDIEAQTKTVLDLIEHALRLRLDVSRGLHPCALAGHEYQVQLVVRGVVPEVANDTGGHTSSDATGQRKLPRSNARRRT